MPPLANFVVSDSEAESGDGDGDRGGGEGGEGGGGGGGGGGYGDTVPTLLIVDGGSPGDAYDNDGPPPPPVNSGSSGLGEYFAGSAGNNNAAASGGESFWASVTPPSPPPPAAAVVLISEESRKRQILSAQAGLIVEVVSSTAAAAATGGDGGVGADPPLSVELSTVDLPVVDLPPAVIPSVVDGEVEKVVEDGEDGDGSFHSSGSFGRVPSAQPQRSQQSSDVADELDLDPDDISKLDRVDANGYVYDNDEEVVEQQRIDDDDDYDDNDAKRKRKTANNGNNNNNTLHKSKTPLRNVSFPDYQESAAAVLKKKVKRPKSEIITKRAKSAMAKFGMGESLRGEEEEEEEDWRPTGNKGKNVTTRQRQKATRSNTADDALTPLLPRTRRKPKEETSTYVAPFKSGISQDMQTSSEKSGSLRFDSGGNVGSAAGGELNASSFVVDLTRPVLSAQQKAEFAPYPATASNPSTAEPQLPKNIPYPAGLPDFGTLVVGSTIPNTPSQPIEPVLPAMEPLEPTMQPLEPDTTHHLQPAITTSPLSSPPGSDPPFIMEEVVIQPRAAVKTTSKKRRAITDPVGTESDQGFGSVASEWRAAKGKAQAGRAHTSPTAELASTRAGSEEWEGVVQVTKGGNKPTKKRKKTTTAAKEASSPKYNLQNEAKEVESLKQPIGRQEPNKRSRMARVIQDSDEDEAEDLGTEADCGDSGADRAPTPPPLPQKATRGANAAGKGPAKPKTPAKRPAPVELDLSPDEEEVVIPKKGRPRGNKQARKPTPQKLNVDDQNDEPNQEQTSIAAPVEEPLVVVATKKAKLGAGTKPKAKRASTTKAAVKEPELSTERVASEDEGSGVEEEKDGRSPAVIEAALEPKVEVPAPVVRPPVVRRAPPTQPYRRVGLSRNAKIEPLLKIRRQI